MTVYINPVLLDDTELQEMADELGVSVDFLTTRVKKYNPNHEPAGSPKGGQFAPAEDGGTESSSDTPASNLVAQHPSQGVTPNELVNRVLNDEQKQKMLAELDQVEKLIGEGEETITKYAGTDGRNGFNKERTALHDKIIQEYIGEAYKYYDEHPTLILLAGRGGSGKSSFDKASGSPAGVYDRKKFLVIDCDDIKGRLAKADGFDKVGNRAALYHEESSVVGDNIRDIARGMRLNVVLDQTLKSPRNDLIKTFKDAGYRVDGHYMFLPREVAAERALGRYIRGGRLVPPTTVLKNVNNEKNFDSLIPQFGSWSVWDNSGDKPKLVARGGGDA